MFYSHKNRQRKYNLALPCLALIQMAETAKSPNQTRYIADPKFCIDLSIIFKNALFVDAISITFNP